MKLELNSVFKKGILIGLVFWASISFGQIDKVWTIQNIAGNGTGIFNSGNLAMNTGFQIPSAMTTDLDGNIYFSVTDFLGGEGMIYKIRKSDNMLVVVLNDVTGISGLDFDTKRNKLYFSMGDGSTTYANEYIWALDMETMNVDSLAGNGLAGLPPNNDEGELIALNEPIGYAAGIKIDPSGDYLYYSCRSPFETFPSFIQKIDLVNGTTRRVVGNNDLLAEEVANFAYATEVGVKVGIGLAWDSNNDLYFAEGHNTIKKIKDGQVFNVIGIGNVDGDYFGDGVPALEAKLNINTSGFVINDNDVLFLCDDNNNVIRRVQLTPNIEGDDEIITTVCGTGDSEGDGDVLKDLTDASFKLAKLTNIKAYDILIVGDTLVISDAAKRLRQVFICNYPTLTDIAVTPETICVGDSVTLSIGDDLKDADMWNWYISDECSSTEMPYGHGQSITVFVEDDFDISVSASGGCLLKQDCLTESFELSCKEFYNTFTPNGDGKNDFFEINTVLNYPLNTVSIYNRWGVLISEIQNYDNVTNVWSGTFNGDLEVNSGTYFFTFESGGETIISGWIELIR